MATSLSDLEIRAAGHDDVEPLARLWALAFPGERTVRERAEQLRTGGIYGGIETAWVGEVAGRLAGAFRIFDLTMHLFGRPVPTAGLAAVAVAPEFRRRGVGAALCRRALELGRGRGGLLSALYPFRADFYARLGYALTGELHRYRFHPRQLPPFPGVGRVRSLPDGDRDAVLPAVYEALAPRCHGLLSRPPNLWEALQHERQLAFTVEGEDGAPRGYLLARTLQKGGGTAELRVRELLAGEPDDYRALLGWISAQRDQWASVVYDALPGERLEHVLAHPRLPGTAETRGLWFRSATVLRGPMVRILNVPGLLERLAADSGIELALEDPELPENTGRWRMEEGSARRTTEEPGGGALLVALASSLLVEGRLGGLLPPRAGFDPALGLTDFRMLDSF